MTPERDHHLRALSYPLILNPFCTRNPIPLAKSLTAVRPERQRMDGRGGELWEGGVVVVLHHEPHNDYYYEWIAFARSHCDCRRVAAATAAAERDSGLK